jgi:hypothetical protein
MPDNSFQDELLRASLDRTSECPPVEALANMLDRPEGADAKTRAHTASCAFCKTELRMLEAFREAEIPASDAEAVQQITGRLRAPSAQIRPGVSIAPPLSSSPSWTERIFGAGWLRPAALALAGALLIIAIGLQLRQRSPLLDTTAGSDVFRSGTFSISSPVGDLQNVPSEIRWETVPSAANYEVHFMEVDHSELWKGTSTQASLEIPADVRPRIVPLKTLLLEIDAFDANGRKVAQSEVVRFRVLQNVYSH